MKSHLKTSIPLRGHLTVTLHDGIQSLGIESFSGLWYKPLGNSSTLLPERQHGTFVLPRQVSTVTVVNSKRGSLAQARRWAL